MVDRKLTGAHYGLGSWILQRITAVMIVVYTIIFMIGLFCLPNDFESWKSFFANSFVKIFTQITIFALIYHAWIGVRDIWMDYIKPTSIRLFFHVLTILWLTVSAIYSVVVIWGI